MHAGINRKTKRSQSRLDYGKLESRQLRAGISFNDGIVQVIGTGLNDVVTVHDEGASTFRVSLNGQSSGYLSKSAFTAVVFHGLDGNDVFSNNSDINSVAFGYGGDDHFTGGSADDFFSGMDGDDYLNGRTGNDTLLGGNHDDELYGHSGRDTIYGQLGDDWMDGGSGDDTMGGNEGRDVIYGSAGDDRLSGGDGADRVYGESGDDRVFGMDGNDRVSGGTGDDLVRGNDGNDRVYGRGGNDIVSGNDGNDHVFGGDDEDTIYGGDGNDRLYGGDGNDRLLGNSGDDKLFGERHDDRLIGADGNDSLYGGSGEDYLSGGAGLDGIYGGAGTDRLRGGLDGDRFISVGSDELIDQRSWDVRIRFSNSVETWNQSEIEVIDRAFEQLHHRTGNTRLLKDARFDRDLTFYKEDSDFAVAGRNQVRDGVRRIFIKDWNANDEDRNLARISTVIHEIAHNFDIVSEINHAMPGQGYRINNFRALSGWSRDDAPGMEESGDGRWYHYRDAEFARSYGKKNPREDFATVWQVYFKLRSGEASGYENIQSKLDAIDGLFNRFELLS